MSVFAIFPTILFILILIIFSGIFSAAETALIGASRARLYVAAKKGNGGAKTVLNLKNNSEKLIGTILLCNNLVNIIAASLATKVFVSFFGDTGVFYASAVMTVLIVIYAEVMPKIYAISNAENLAIFISAFTTHLIKIASPITYLFEKIARITLSLFGIPMSSHIHIKGADDELRGAIDLHQNFSGNINAKAMLHSILDLSDVHVSEIMIHRSDVTMLNADTNIQEIVNQVIASPYTRIPFWQGNTDNIIGILNAKALLRAMHIHQGNIQGLKIQDIISKPWFVPDTSSLQEQLQAFRDRKEHFALVVDEYGAFEGIVTLEDILEEIVGEITDEHDVRIPGVWGQMNGDIFVTGGTTLRDLNRQFNWNLPDEDASTIAGLVLHVARHIPKTGQIFDIQGFRIRVLRRVRNKITLLRITPPFINFNPS